MIDQRRNCEERDRRENRKLRNSMIAFYSILGVSILALTHTIYAAL
jgi:hypothetical protein